MSLAVVVQTATVMAVARVELRAAILFTCHGVLQSQHRDICEIAHSSESLIMVCFTGQLNAAHTSDACDQVTDQ